MSSKAHEFTNRLEKEKSPYLLQHAHNPVDWYPWGAEALGRARAEDKPILLSIGYATCHWCHVMERESFEDPELAGYLNEHFVAIKVDREERPDVDRIYMDALQNLAGQGGWPLNMFLTPDRLPFTGGTYFPPRPAHGRPSFRQVLERVTTIWTEQRELVHETSAQLTERLTGPAEAAKGELSMNGKAFESLLRICRESYDERYKGFRLQAQNKFPPSMTLMQLLREFQSSGDAKLLVMVEDSLEAMKRGGIYDQLGGGLSRYSTDPRWLVPHFEKMLYDNALWIEVLTEAFQVTGRQRYRRWVEDAVGYIDRDMSAPSGAFFCAEDADSEGVEGKFYVWSEEEFHQVLGCELAELAGKHWGLSWKGNFEGQNILTEKQTVSKLAAECGDSMESVLERLSEARSQLMEQRSKRVRPLLDDKILTSWNALMITAYAKAGRVFGRSDWVERASQAGSFLLQELRDETGRLLRRWRAGEARFPAYLVDHAQLAVACLELHEASGDGAWFDEAQLLMESVDELFRNDGGAYFDTGKDAEELLTRTAEGYDGVEPSGNSAAAWAFVRLYALSGRESYRENAERILRSFQEQFSGVAVGYAFMLRSLDYLHWGAGQLILIGEAGEANFEEIAAALRSRFLPGHQVLVLESGELKAEQGRFPILAGREAIAGKATVYLCRNQSCALPIHDLAALEKALAEGIRS